MAVGEQCTGEPKLHRSYPPQILLHSCTSLRPWDTSWGWYKMLFDPGSVCLEMGLSCIGFHGNLECIKLALWDYLNRHRKTYSTVWSGMGRAVP